MRLLVLLVLLVPLVTAWSQCGSPSERVVKVDSIDVQTAIKRDQDNVEQHWIRVEFKGSSSRLIPASATLQPSARLGAIRMPLDPFHLGRDLGPGQVDYVYEAFFQAPSDLTTHVKLTVSDGENIVLCIRDLEVKL